VHETKLGLDHDVVTGAIGVRSCLAIAGNRGVDQGRVDLVNAVEVEAVLGQRSWEIILDEDVALGGQPVEEGDSRRILKGQAQRLLVTVHLKELAGGA